MGAQLEELPCLAQDEAAREAEGKAAAGGEEGGDRGGGGEVGGEIGFEDGQFGAAGKAGGKGDFGEDCVDGLGVGGRVWVGGWAVQFGAEDDGVASDGAGLAVYVFYVVEVFGFNGFSVWKMGRREQSAGCEV